MTLEELAALETETFTPAQIAPVLGVNPQKIRIQAAENPESLGFPVTVVGTRVKIPKRPFLRHMGI